MTDEMVPSARIAVFKGKSIRKTLHNNEWWFAVTDVVAALTDSTNPSGYIKDMRRRDEDLNKGWGQLATPLSIQTDGGPQKINCANTEGIFRIIQAIPSPKAEPFKRWLAKVGYERIQEIEDPELASKRIRAIYKAKGYSDEWIEKRMRGASIHQQLTNEWKNRGIKEDREYSILTAEISKAAFGLTPSDYKKIKGLGRENLRDHMTDLELIFTMLSEASTTEITRNKNAQGFNENRQAAIEGGSVAGAARRDLEKKSGKKVVSQANYLEVPECEKKIKPEVEYETPLLITVVTPGGQEITGETGDADDIAKLELAHQFVRARFKGLYCPNMHAKPVKVRVEVYDMRPEIKSVTACCEPFLLAIKQHFGVS